MALAVAGERQKKGVEEAGVHPMMVTVGEEPVPMHLEHLLQALVWSEEEGEVESRQYCAPLGEADLKMEVVQMEFWVEAVVAPRSQAVQLSSHWHLGHCGAKIEEEHGLVVGEEVLKISVLLEKGEGH